MESYEPKKPFGGKAADNSYGLPKVPAQQACKLGASILLETFKVVYLLERFFFFFVRVGQLCSYSLLVKWCQNPACYIHCECFANSTGFWLLFASFQLEEAILMKI